MFILDSTEVEKLTGKVRRTSQILALKEMGIPFAIRLDGRPIVTTDAVKNFVDPGSVVKVEEATLNLVELT